MIQTSKPHHLPVKSKGSVNICCCILRTENELNLKNQDVTEGNSHYVKFKTILPNIFIKGTPTAVFNKDQ